MNDVMHNTEWDVSFGKLFDDIESAYKDIGCEEECKKELAVLFQKRYPEQYEELRFEHDF